MTAPRDPIEVAAREAATPSTDLAPCRDACLAESEPLAGSGSAATTWLGLSWPKPRWHRSKIAQSPGLPEEIAGLEAFAERQGQKLALRLFQRTPASSIEFLEMVLARPGEGQKLFDVPIALAASIAQRFLCGEPLGFESRPLGPELFVCTDGKHDRCCAQFGRPLFKQLLQTRAELGLQVEISEVSHIGGHRFAANCLALPDGFLYGRVELTDAEELLRRTTAGECLPRRLRGRLGEPELHQVACAYARLRGLSNAAPQVEETIVEPKQARVRLSFSGRDACWVICERRQFLTPASCGDESSAGDLRQRWVATSLEPCTAG